MREIIRLENVVSMHNGRREVNGLDLCVEEKKCVMVCGAAGSGRSALMRLIAGMERPGAGKVFVMEKAVHDMNADTAASFRNRNIGIIMSEPGFMESLSILENISLPLAVRAVSSFRREKEASEQMAALGISHTAYARPSQLSAYEAVLACIARALIAQPKILLLYEAAAGLTEKETEQITGIVNALSEYGDYTVLSFAAKAAPGLLIDRTVLLEHGSIQEEEHEEV